MRKISREAFVHEFPRLMPERKISGKSDGKLELTEPVLFMGIHDGPLAVAAPGYAIIHGIVNGPVTIEAGAIAWLFGIIEGDLHVAGAASVEGIVNGKLYAQPNATIAVDATVTLDDFADADSK